MASETKAQPDTTAAKYDGWLTPKAARAMVLKHMSWEQSALQIYEALIFDHLRAIGRKIYIGGQKRPDNQVIPHNLWQNARTEWLHSDLWSTGQISIEIPIASRAFSGDTQELKLFGVRFDPAGINQIIQDAGGAVPKPTVPAPVAPSEDADDSAQKKRVSEADLKAWHELYSRLYPGNGYSIEHAVESAKGMFPDKSVARDRVRELVGGDRKPGRKRKSELA